MNTNNVNKSNTIHTYMKEYLNMKAFRHKIRLFHVHLFPFLLWPCLPGYKFTYRIFIEILTAVNNLFYIINFNVSIRVHIVYVYSVCMFVHIGTYACSVELKLASTSPLSMSWGPNRRGSVGLSLSYFIFLFHIYIIIRKFNSNFIVNQ